MSGQVDLSVAKPGDVCHMRNGHTVFFEGRSSEKNYDDWRTHPFLVGIWTFRQDGTFRPDDSQPHNYDIVRVTRDGVQITPAVEPGSILKEEGTVPPVQVLSKKRDLEICEHCRSLKEDHAPGGLCLKYSTFTPAIRFAPIGEYQGFTYPKEFDNEAAQEKWRQENCPRGMHLFDECGGLDGHYLHCDACELLVHIGRIEYTWATVPKRDLKSENDDEPEELIPSPPEDVNDLRDALWVCMEHNRLHHGPNHNTVIQAEEALSGWTPNHRMYPQNPIANGPAAILKGIRYDVLESNGLVPAAPAVAVITGPGLYQELMAPNGKPAEIVGRCAQGFWIGWSASDELCAWSDGGTPEVNTGHCDHILGRYIQPDPSAQDISGPAPPVTQPAP